MTSKPLNLEVEHGTPLRHEYKNFIMSTKYINAEFKVIHMSAGDVRISILNSALDYHKNGTSVKRHTSVIIYHEIQFY